MRDGAGSRHEGLWNANACAYSPSSPSLPLSLSHVSRLITIIGITHHSVTRLIITRLILLDHRSWRRILSTSSASLTPGRSSTRPSSDSTTSASTTQVKERRLSCSLSSDSDMEDRTCVDKVDGRQITISTKSMQLKYGTARGSVCMIAMHTGTQKLKGAITSPSISLLLAAWMMGSSSS